MIFRYKLNTDKIIGYIPYNQEVFITELRRVIQFVRPHIKYSSALMMLDGLLVNQAGDLQITSGSDYLSQAFSNCSFSSSNDTEIPQTVTNMEAETDAALVSGAAADDDQDIGNESMDVFYN
jgi:hypothetical protein